jgi:hypothetical protein
MHLAQQLEVNLRAILYAADYHGWGAGIELLDAELKRYKDTSAFIDGATCGLIIEKLRATGIIPDRRAWRAFERACEHRNRLAHSFLGEQDFDAMTVQREAAIVRQLHEMTLDLYPALLISRSVRDRAEIHADEQHRSLREFMRRVGIEDYDDPSRRYAPRKRKQKSGVPAA